MKKIFHAAILLIGFAAITAACSAAKGDQHVENPQPVNVLLVCPASANCRPGQRIRLFESATIKVFVGSVAQNTEAVRLQAPTTVGGKEYCNVSANREDGGPPLVGWLTCDYVQLVKE